MELGVTAVMLPELDFEEQIALCVELGLRYYQYRPRAIAADQRDKPWNPWGNHKFDLTPERLAKEGAQLTRRLRDAGMEPWGTVPSLDVDRPDDDIKLGIEGAIAAEARCVRVGPPSYPGEPFDYAALLDHVIERYAHIIDTLSGPAGIRLIVETHNRSLATAPGLAWNIVHHFPPERIGVIFDLPNFAIEGEVKPTLAVSVLRDYIDCCHVGGCRRSISGTDALGFKTLASQMCPIRESDIHVPSYLRTLHAAGLEPPLIIEDFTPAMTGADRLRLTAQALHGVLADL
ncbi:sugar phosphate isomerase/epimerase [bacterium]|nr:sugar phosphate isomerase/epimerase [bacterium]